jgi:hypothetical protein
VRAVRRTVAAVVAASAITGCASRAELDTASLGPAGPSIGDHLHVAYGVFVCDGFLEVAEGFDSQVGIHTHDDDVIHVHPFSGGGAGSNATLGRFVDGANRVSLEDGELTVDGTTYRDGDACDGEPAQVVVARWADGTDAASGVEIHTTGVRDLRLARHGEAVTIAFVSDPDSLEPPPSVAYALELGHSYSS